MSPNTTKDRERKWLYMIANWDREMTKNFRKVIKIKINYFKYKIIQLLFGSQVQNRCKKGIPQSIRPKAWLYLTRANILIEENKNIYFKLCDQPGDRKWIEDIKKDLHRQFPYHEMFVNPDGTG